MKNNDKTNVMRILTQHKIEYKAYYYGDGTALSGAEVAAELGQDPDHVFKTLVAVGKTKEHYVFMVPVQAELDLKKAAQAAGEKNIEMIKQKELLPLTGYVHGGCSPIGMKKQFKTVIDESAQNFDTIFFSAGKIGAQVEVDPKELAEMIGASFAELVCG